MKVRSTASRWRLAGVSRCWFFFFRTDQVQERGKSRAQASGFSADSELPAVSAPGLTRAAYFLSARRFRKTAPGEGWGTRGTHGGIGTIGTRNQKLLPWPERRAEGPHLRGAISHAGPIGFSGVSFRRSRVSLSLHGPASVERAHDEANSATRAFLAYSRFLRCNGISSTRGFSLSC